MCVDITILNEICRQRIEGIEKLDDILTTACNVFTDLLEELDCNNGIFAVSPVSGAPRKYEQARIKRHTPFSRAYASR